jgi:hypothetical protein
MSWPNCGISKKDVIKRPYVDFAESRYADSGHELLWDIRAP